MMRQQNLQPQSQQQEGREMNRKQWPQRVILQQHPGGASQKSGVFYLQEVDRGERVNHFQGEKSRLFGKFHIGFGCICIVLNSITVGLKSNDDSFYFFRYGTFFGFGIWNGLLFITSGILFMIAGAKRTKCLIVACLVMCILSAVSILMLFTFGIIEAVNFSRDRLLTLLNCLLAFMAIPEAIVSILASRVCCSVMCQCFDFRNTHEIVFIPQSSDPAHHMSDANFVQVTSQQTQPSGVDPNSSMNDPCSLESPHYRPPMSSTDDATASMPHNSVFYQTKPDRQDDQLLIVTPEEPDDDDTLLLC